MKKIDAIEIIIDFFQKTIEEDSAFILPDNFQEARELFSREFVQQIHDAVLEDHERT